MEPKWRWPVGACANAMDITTTATWKASSVVAHARTAELGPGMEFLSVPTETLWPKSYVDVYIHLCAHVYIYIYIYIHAFIC